MPEGVGSHSIEICFLDGWIPDSIPEVRSPDWGASRSKEEQIFCISWPDCCEVPGQFVENELRD